MGLGLGLRFGFGFKFGLGQWLGLGLGLGLGARPISVAPRMGWLDITPVAPRAEVGGVLGPSWLVRVRVRVRIKP